MKAKGQGPGTKIEDGGREGVVKDRCVCVCVRNRRYEVESKCDDAGGEDSATMSQGLSHGKTPSRKPGGERGI